MSKRLGAWWAETHGTRFELLRHFLAGFFDSELFAQPGEWVRPVAGIAGLAASASIFLAYVTSSKYTALIVHAGRHGLDLNALCRRERVSDQVTLVLLLVCFTVLLAALLWWSLYPTRQDYLALAALPIRSSEIFTAKFAGLLIVFCAFVLLLAGPAALVFCAASAGPWTPSGSLWASIVTCFSAMSAGSVLAFFALVGIQGVLLNILPVRIFERVSVAVQSILVAAAAGCVPIVLNARFTIGAEVLLRPGALLAGGAAVVFAVGAYLISYHRHRRILIEAASPKRSAAASRHWWIKDPREQAAFSFIASAIGRNRTHRLTYLLYAGLGVVYVIIGSTQLFIRQNQQGSDLLSDAVAGSLTLAVFSLLGLRHVFALPVELTANWIFRLTEREGRQAWARAVDRFALGCGVAPILLAGSALAASSHGPLEAAAWFVLSSCFSGVVFEGLFRDWRKMPFTCTYRPGKRPLVLVLALYIVLLPLLVTFSRILVWASQNRTAFAVVLGLELALWWLIRRDRRRHWGVLPMQYEERAEIGIDLFDLNGEGTTLAQEEFQREWRRHAIDVS